MLMPPLEGPPWGTPKPSVAPRCPRCFAGGARGQKFCGACGASLPRRCKRKHVTVLLTDVSGFTAMSERLDPEDVRAILDRAFDIVLDAVHTHGGTVNQFLGDGVMALFDDSDSDDHATRAVRAALAIEASLAPVRGDVQRAHGVAFTMRVGIHSGEVAFGVIGDGLRTDYVPQGETTGTAARLVSLAGAGRILVSAATRELTDGAFIFTPLENICATADAAPLPAWTLASGSLDDIDAEAGLLVEM